MMAQVGIAFAQDDRLINREDAIVAWTGAQGTGLGGTLSFSYGSWPVLDDCC
jgi:hypothetical protein